VGAAGAWVAAPAQTAQVRAKVSPAIPSYVLGAKVKGILELPGTDALQDLGEEWNKAFKARHPEGGIAYIAKLSSEAIEDLVGGKHALVLSARDITPNEMARFKAAYGYQPMRIPVCLDATVVFVHRDNPLSAISMEQLDAIYSATRLGGAKEPIVTWGDLQVHGELAKRNINAYSRAAGAATRTTFKASALKNGEFRAGILDKEDSPALAEAVATDEVGIAYGPLASWSAANKILPVVPYQGAEARFPNQENITSSRYPMPRLYFAYVNRVPGKPLDPAINEFLHFVLSQEGQNAVAEAGLLPGPPEFLTIALKRLDR
jgi:phosphate transport system substrate-binding protein